MEANTIMFVAHEFRKQEMDDLRYAIETAFEATGLKSLLCILGDEASPISSKKFVT